MKFCLKLTVLLLLLSARCSQPPRKCDPDLFQGWVDLVGVEADKADSLLVFGLADSLTGEPVISAKFLSGGRAVVKTGEHRGTLDGGGTLLFLTKSEHGWEVYFSGWWAN